MTILDAPQGETSEQAAPATQAGWFDDPTGSHAMRYFNGQTWTDHVTHYGPSPCDGCGSLVAG